MSDPADIRQAKEGSQKTTSVSSRPSNGSLSLTFNARSLVHALVVVVVAIVAFWLGIAYESHHKTVAVSNSFSNGTSGGSGSFRGRGGGFGQVTSISSSS